jgi:hypothetical protein
MPIHLPTPTPHGLLPPQRHRNRRSTTPPRTSMGGGSIQRTTYRGKPTIAGQATSASCCLRQWGPDVDRHAQTESPAAAAGLRRLPGLADKPAERDQAGLSAHDIAEPGKGRGQLGGQQGVFGRSGSTGKARRFTRGGRSARERACGARPCLRSRSSGDGFARAPWCTCSRPLRLRRRGETARAQWLNRVHAAALS